MHLRSASHRLTFLTLLLLALAAPSAHAFDCTPIATLDLGGITQSDFIGANAVPGEPLCGFDYTGWQFHVYDFTLTAPALQVLHLATADGVLGTAGDPYADLILLNQCDPNACLVQHASTAGLNPDPICLPAGTYTVVVASQDVGPNNIYNVGTASFSACAPVANESGNWGTVKSRF